MNTISKTKVSFVRGSAAAFVLMALLAFSAPSAQAQTRLIVRDSLGLSGIKLTCALLGCDVNGGLGDRSIIFGHLPFDSEPCNQHSEAQPSAWNRERRN